MKADALLSECGRTGSDAERELRVALDRCHVAMLDEQRAFDTLKIALGVRGLRFQAMADRLRD